MKRNPVETILGAVVLIVAGFFMAFAYSVADLKQVEGYQVTANFYKIGGLETGSDVRISGIKVGSVAAQKLDKVDFSAVLTLSLKPEVKLPVDTVATIASDGLMGGKYLKLEPGSDNKTTIEPGGVIRKTRDYKSLEDSVSEIIFLVTEPGNKG